MPWWAQAFVLGVVGVSIYLALLRRIRRRHWPDGDTIIIPREGQDTPAKDQGVETGVRPLPEKGDKDDRRG